MTIEKIIERAVRMGRVQGGLVLCDNCDNPADGPLSRAVGWTGCAPCVWGEADSIDPANFVAVGPMRVAHQRVANK
jgi:hypothetical protein